MTKIIGVAVLSVTAVSLLVSWSSFHLNLSDSAPSGLWMVRPIDLGRLKRGAIVSVCPPALPIVRKLYEQGLLTQGDCPETNVIPFLKAIAAMPGDTVTLRTGKPLMVNGVELPNTAAKNTAVAWPDGEYIVKPYQVWVLSTYSPDSFDSRYFGPVDIFNILSGAVPLFVNGHFGNMRIGVQVQYD